MTTIAWKENVMASDTQVSIGNYKTNTEKLYSIPGLGVLGLAGTTKHCYKVYRWWASGCTEEEPEISEGDVERGSGVQGLLCTDEGLFFLEDGTSPTLIKAPFMAIGSGGDYALSAMGLGASAADSIKEAMIHDIYTGGNIDTVECTQYFYKPKAKKKVPAKKQAPKKKARKK